MAGFAVKPFVEFPAVDAVEIGQPFHFLPSFVPWVVAVQEHHPEAADKRSDAVVVVLDGEVSAVASKVATPEMVLRL